MNEKPHFVELGMDGNTLILKWILNEQLCRVQFGEIDFLMSRVIRQVKKCQVIQEKIKCL